MEAAIGWADDTGIGQSQGLPSEPSWQAFAVFLYCGKIYEKSTRYAQQCKGQVNESYEQILAVIQESANRRWQDLCGHDEPAH